MIMILILMIQLHFDYPTKILKEIQMIAGTVGDFEGRKILHLFIAIVQKKSAKKSEFCARAHQLF